MLGTEQTKYKKQTLRIHTVKLLGSSSSRAEGQIIICHRVLALLWVPSVDKNQHSHFLLSFPPLLLPPQESRESCSVTQTCRKISSCEIIPSPEQAEQTFSSSSFPSPLLCVLRFGAQLQTGQLNQFSNAEQEVTSTGRNGVWNLSHNSMTSKRASTGTGE